MHTRVRVTSALFAAVFAAGTLHAQSPADVNLFGGDPPKIETQPREEPGLLGLLVRKLASSPVKAAPKVEGLAHTLTFQDGRQLRGELVSLSKGELLWKRADASEILRFTRAEVRNITFNDDPPRQYYQEQIQLQMINGNPVEAPKAAPKPSPATVKLPGGDWLYADVKSADGETFELSLGGESKFTVPRAAIDWLHFGLAPAPAANLTVGEMSLEGWVKSNPGARIEEKDGWMNVSNVEWLGCNLSPPSRFEIAFDLPADDKTSTTLWVQPFGPQPNCYGTGTVQLEIRPGEINRCIYINNLKHEKSTTPQDAGPDNRASFRVLYDGVDGKVLVYRNGKQVGDWKLREEEEAKVNRGWQRGINGVCLQRNGGLKLGRFRVQPWDGALPKENEPARTQDLLSMGKEAPVTGKLESITDSDLVFSGAKKVRGGGVFLQLHSDPKPMAGVEALLLFGSRGELGAAELEVREGRAKFRTSFAGVIEVPISALNIIGFSPAKVDGPAAGALVFKNGDELPGSLLRAESGAPLKWKTAAGQEIEFKPERVAGVRFAPLAEAKLGEGATVELRNGDKIRGEFTGLDGKKLQLKHPQLGVLGIDRARVWSLFPNAKTTIFDAANDPAPWLGLVPRRGQPVPAPATPKQVHLDGRFLMRMISSNNGFNSGSERTYISRSLKGLPEKFELRCEVLDVSGQEPNLGIRFSSEDERNNANSSLDLEFNYGSLRLYGWVSGGRSRSFWKDVALRERNGRYEPQPRFAVRCFVDNKTGTVDVFVNGEHKVKSGQAANERVPGVGGNVSISGYGSGTTPVIVSDIWAGPWNGEVPRAGMGAAVTLSNGDIAEATPTELRDGKLLVDPGSGEMIVPLDRVDAIGFGGTTEPVRCAGRLRLNSGDSVGVESFKFDGGEITARSAVLGEVRLPVAAVRELVFDAAPARFPLAPEPKKKPAAEKPEAGEPAPAAAPAPAQAEPPGVAPQ
jgi:hypothetical protein